MHFDYKGFHGKGITVSDTGYITAVDLSKVDKTIAEGKDHSNEADVILFMENMAALEKYCNVSSKTQFFQFFQDAIVGAYHRYRQHKKHAWSWLQYLPWLICSAILPVISAIVLQAFADGSGVLTVIPTVFAGLIVAAWVFLYVYTKWVENKGTKETWVRHSACFGRLNLALSKFILSEKKEEEYNEFVLETFAILEQNIDQFALNLSGQGLATRFEDD